MYRGLTYASENYGEFDLIWKSFVIIDIRLYDNRLIDFQLVFNDGSSDNLFNVNGTIPINYKSK